jgi:hypothetical protein
MGIMMASLQTANMTRVKRGRNAKMTQHDAKNNAGITRNNAGVRRSTVEWEAVYVLYLRELRPDVGSNSKKYHPVLVNINWLAAAADPRRSRLLGGLWSRYILGLHRTRPVSAHQLSVAVPPETRELHGNCGSVYLFGSS